MTGLQVVSDFFAGNGTDPTGIRALTPCTIVGEGPGRYKSEERKPGVQDHHPCPLSGKLRPKQQRRN